jgi:chromosome segregation ATPase
MNQMSEALKSAKTLQTELTQWENRVEHARNEHENLKRQSEILQGEIDQKRTEYQNYISTHEKQIREGLDTIAKGNTTLEAQRNEFKTILETHDKEKSKLAFDKAEFVKEKSRTDGKRQLVEDFIQAIRRAYNVLPDA